MKKQLGDNKSLEELMDFIHREEPVVVPPYTEEEAEEIADEMMDRIRHRQYDRAMKEFF